MVSTNELAFGSQQRDWVITHVFALHLCGLDVHSRQRIGTPVFKAFCLEIACHVLGWMAVWGPRKDWNPSKHSIGTKATKKYHSRKKHAHQLIHLQRQKVEYGRMMNSSVHVWLHGLYQFATSANHWRYESAIVVDGLNGCDFISIFTKRFAWVFNSTCSSLNNLDMCLMFEDFYTILLSKWRVISCNLM